jgi:hypothetical protein
VYERLNEQFVLFVLKFPREERGSIPDDHDCSAAAVGVGVGAISAVCDVCE